MDRPQRIINALAPIRICDNGGWTDTWFAKHGKVFNIAVYPYAEVQLAVFGRVHHAIRDQPRVTIFAENYGERYAMAESQRGAYAKHPLLEAAIEYMRVPDDMSVVVSIYSDAPV